MANTTAKNITKLTGNPEARLSKAEQRALRNRQKKAEASAAPQGEEAGAAPQGEEAGAAPPQAAAKPPRTRAEILEQAAAKRQKEAELAARRAREAADKAALRLAAAQVKAARAERETVADVIKRGIEAGATNDTILAEVASKFPASKATKKDIQFYKWKAKQPPKQPLAKNPAESIVAILSRGATDKPAEQILEEALSLLKSRQQASAQQLAS